MLFLPSLFTGTEKWYANHKWNSKCWNCRLGEHKIGNWWCINCQHSGSVAAFCNLQWWCLVAACFVMWDHSEYADYILWTQPQLRTDVTCGNVVINKLSVKALKNVKSELITFVFFVNSVTSTVWEHLVPAFVMDVVQHSIGGGVCQMHHLTSLAWQALEQSSQKSL